jgi:ABC-2 type transport system ATP-binding protein
LNNNAVAVENLIKIYPKVKAVDDISFSVEEGEIFGFLGPNGAGKTTTIRILLTLIKPTSGNISVFNTSVLRQPGKVRQMAGYISQDVSVDGDLTGYENILLYSKLYGLASKERGVRINEVVEYLDLQERIGDMVNTYSGGMMRRLEIAQALVNRPKILFLDEPSIGLDPNARRIIWELVKNLREEFGTTIFLTTHDMGEADMLCDRIGIMSKGKLVVLGQPAQLKATVGGDVVSIVSKTPALADRLKGLGLSVISESSEDQVDLLVTNGERLIPHLLETLKTAGVEVEAVSLKKPSLDDVFLKYTGTRMGEGEGDSWRQARKERRTFRRLSR